MYDTMNAYSVIGFLGCVVAALVISGSSFTYAAGGSLTPPGAPGVTMKTLDEVGPGTPINPADVAVTGMTISTPGYYYLTGNIENVPATSAAILITASNVTLDMKGFAIIADGGTGAVASASAIYSSGATRHSTVVRNGSIEGAWYAGVYLLGQATSRCENLRVYQTASYGLVMGVGSHVSDCQIDGKSSSVNAAGITVSHGSVIKNCSVVRCLGDAFQPAGGRSSILGCTATENGGLGFEMAEDTYVLTDCVSALNAGGGYDIGANCSVSRCTAYLNTGDGFLVGKGSVVSFCSSFNNTKDGFDIGSGVKIRSCVATENDEDGFNIDNNCNVSDSIASENNFVGFRAASGNSFLKCTSNENGVSIANQFSDGFYVQDGNRIKDCLSYNNHGNGVQAASINNDIRDNHIYSNNIDGIKLTFTTNRVTGNYVPSNTGMSINPAPAALGDIGPLESANSGTSPNANHE